MANTTNYNWETPDDTDLVKDGAAAIRTLGSSVDTTTKALNPSTTLGDIEYRSATANTNTRLAIGTTGQVLTVAGGVPTWATSDDANAIQNAIVDAKGDIVAASAADTPARLAVGSDNHRLVAASGETTGLKYVADTQNTVIDAEGDLLVGDAADTVQRLPIGSNGQVLTVDTSVDGKIKWATPAAGGGKVLQVVSVSKTDTFTTTSTTFTDITGLSASITPSSTNSKILVIATVCGAIDANTNRQFRRLMRDSTAISVGTSVGSRNATSFGTPDNDEYAMDSVTQNFLDSPASTSSLTYKIQVRTSSGTTFINRSDLDSDNDLLPRGASNITLLEIGA